MNNTPLIHSFNRQGEAETIAPIRLTAREFYYYMVNIEEHPEVLPFAYDYVEGRFSAAEVKYTETPGASPDSAETLAETIERLSEMRGQFARPWRQISEDLTRQWVLHYFTQYMPMALVDGCYLQGGVRVASAFTPEGAALTQLYAHQLRALITDTGKHFVSDYRAAYSRLGQPLKEVSTHSFSNTEAFYDKAFVLPSFLMAVSPFTQTWTAEILGINLAWQYLGLSAFGPDLIHDLCSAYHFPLLGEEGGDLGYLARGRDLAKNAVVTYLAGRGASELRAVQRGIASCVTAWNEWFSSTKAATSMNPTDSRQEMLNLLSRKASHAFGYHADKELVDRRIDDHFNPSKFDAAALLEELARSRFIKPGQADGSAFIRLTKFGGPMLSVFTPDELTLIRNWINSLPPRDADIPTTAVMTPPTKEPEKREEVILTGRAWEVSQLQQQSQQRYGACSKRELYYYLVNLEHYPDVLPTAERFVSHLLEQSMAMLQKGERPIPSWRYDPEALKRWVYAKHRDQINSYRPPGVRPEVPKERFIEATVQLAPLILIDGAWLQQVASPALIHTTVGRMLFHLFIEEIGEGQSKKHHANIYRNLLSAMGEEAPPIDTWEFARWKRLRDASFDVPILWLTLSCFPRHFLPEILGLNLTAEIAGVGGPYMEARDTLDQFGFPTLFVDVHNAADNVTAGHTAWAMNTIMQYMDEVAEREGPHGVDHAWHRVWSGVRATLPAVGGLRMAAYRIGRRLFGEETRQTPLIFPN
jgi:hypothetical protein